MVSPHSIHLVYFVRERHRLVDEQLEEVVRRGLSGEQLELLVHRPVPGDDHPGCDLFREPKHTGEREGGRGSKGRCQWVSSRSVRARKSRLESTHDDSSHGIQVCQAHQSIVGVEHSHGLSEKDSHSHHTSLEPPADMRRPIHGTTNAETRQSVSVPRRENRLAEAQVGIAKTYRSR